MTRLEGTAGARVRIAACVAAMVVLACSSGRDRDDRGGKRDVRGEMMTEASENYNYGAERAAVQVPDSTLVGGGGPLPTLTIAPAIRVNATGRVASTYIVGRIHSNTAYPRMGLAGGYNYVWRDSGTSPGAGVRLLLIPQDSAYPMYFLNMTVTHPAPGGPPLVIFSSSSVGACTDGCPAGHCTAKDTSRAYDPRTDSATVRALLR